MLEKNGQYLEFIDGGHGTLHIQVNGGGTWPTEIHGSHDLLRYFIDHEGLCKKYSDGKKFGDALTLDALDAFRYKICYGRSDTRCYVRKVNGQLVLTLNNIGNLKDFIDLDYIVPIGHDEILIAGDNCLDVLFDTFGKMVMSSASENANK